MSNITWSELDILRAHERMFGPQAPPPAADLPPLPTGERLSFILPLPVSVNALYTTTPAGKRVLTKVGRAYKVTVGQHIMHQRRVRYAPLRGSISLTVHVYPPDHRWRDLDNMNKVLGDALTDAGIWLDDHLVDELHWKRFPAHKGEGYICVMIEELSGEVGIL